MGDQIQTYMVREQKWYKFFNCKDSQEYKTDWVTKDNDINDLSIFFVAADSDSLRKYNSNIPKGTKIYSAFPRLHAFYLWMKKLDCASFYDMMKGTMGMRPHFDIDLSAENDPRHKYNDDNIPTLMVNAICKVMKEKLNITINKADFGKEFMICSSHGQTPTGFKHSYHITMNNYQCYDNLNCREFSRLVINEIDDEELRTNSKIIDLSPYGANQQFRLLCSGKYNPDQKLMRYKSLMKEWKYFTPEGFDIIQYKLPNVKLMNDGKDNDRIGIAIMQKSLLKCYDGIMISGLYVPPVRHFKTDTVFNLTDSQSNSFFEIIDRKFGDDFYTIDKEYESGFLTLFRHKGHTTYCDICKKNHKNSDAYVRLFENGDVKFGCFRSKAYVAPGQPEMLLIGNIDVTKVPDPENEEEEDNIIENVDKDSLSLVDEYNLKVVAGADPSILDELLKRIHRKMEEEVALERGETIKTFKLKEKENKVLERMFTQKFPDELKIIKEKNIVKHMWDITDEHVRDPTLSLDKDINYRYMHNPLTFYKNKVRPYMKYRHTRFDRKNQTGGFGVYNEVSDYFVKKGIFIKKGPMGTGKTKVNILLNKEFSKYGESSMHLTSRIAQSRDYQRVAIKDDVLDFETYQNTMDHNGLTNFTESADSIMKRTECVHNIFISDILDVFRQFDSTLMYRKEVLLDVNFNPMKNKKGQICSHIRHVREDNINALLNLSRQARRIYIDDADVEDERVKLFLEKARPGEKPNYEYLGLKAREGYTATRYMNKNIFIKDMCAEIARMKEYNEYNDQLIAAGDKGQYKKNHFKIAIPCGSKTFADKLLLRPDFLEAIGNDLTKVLYLHRDTDNKLLILSKIEETLDDKWVIIFTPTIGSGVDIQTKCQQVWAYTATTGSIVATQFKQMIGRVRNNEEKKLFYYIYECQNYDHDKPIKYEGLLKYMEHKFNTSEKYREQLCSQLGLTNLVEEFRDRRSNQFKLRDDNFGVKLYIYNQLEIAQSQKDFIKIFESKLVDEGYVLKVDCSAPSSIESDAYHLLNIRLSETIEHNNKEKFNSVRVWDPEMIPYLESQILNDTAHTDARIEVTKSKEIHKFKEEHHERLLDKDKDMFYKLYKHKNIVTALNLLTNYPQKQNILDNYKLRPDTKYSFMDLFDMRLHLIREVWNNILGWEEYKYTDRSYVYDKQKYKISVYQKTIERNKNWFIENYGTISVATGYRGKISKDDVTLRFMTGCINAILGGIGIKIKEDMDHRSNKNKRYLLRSKNFTGKKLEKTEDTTAAEIREFYEMIDKYTQDIELCVSDKWLKVYNSDDEESADKDNITENPAFQ